MTPGSLALAAATLTLALSSACGKLDGAGQQKDGVEDMAPPNTQLLVLEHEYGGCGDHGRSESWRLDSLGSLRHVYQDLHAEPGGLLTESDAVVPLDDARELFSALMALGFMSLERDAIDACIMAQIKKTMTVHGCTNYNKYSLTLTNGDLTNTVALGDLTDLAELYPECHDLGVYLKAIALVEEVLGVDHPVH